ncbi:MAG: hypothetical protein R2744_05615 [Bacteroidales bacterium]
MRFYTRSYATGAGERYELNLPDGSVASLNVNTMVSYHPLWWKFSKRYGWRERHFSMFRRELSIE